MGLDIRGPNKSYHYSYGALHDIRHLAYKVCGGQKNYLDFMQMLRSGESYDWSYFMALIKFPNLIWHSDSNGIYTAKGKVRPFDKPGTLDTGNIYELFRELKELRKRGSNLHEDSHSLEVFNTFYDVVSDCLKNGKKVVRFH